MVQMDADLLKALGVVTTFYITLLIYSRVKRRFCVVPQPEADTQAHALDEKSALLSSDGVKAGAADIEGQHDVTKVSEPLPKSLIAWAVFILPVNIAAFYVPNYYWSPSDVDASEPGAISCMLLNATAVLPILAAISVLVMALVLARPNLPTKAEKLHTHLRMSMLDGALLPPFIFVWLDYEYPGTFDTLNWTTLAFAAYASQAFVWSLFFRRSKREAMEKAAAIRLV